jgi:hypothetical protein
VALGAWSLELGAWSLELGAWSLLLAAYLFQELLAAPDVSGTEIPLIAYEII